VWKDRLRKKFYDTDVKAETAIDELHSKGVDNYKIQQSLSTGILGQEENRKLVPTRWSITASDDMISKKATGRCQTVPATRAGRILHERIRWKPVPYLF